MLNPELLYATVHGSYRVMKVKVSKSNCSELFHIEDQTEAHRPCQRASSGVKWPSSDLDTRSFSIQDNSKTFHVHLQTSGFSSAAQNLIGWQT